MYSVNRKDGGHTPFDVSRCDGTFACRWLQCFVTRLVLVDLQCASQTVLWTVGCCTALFSHPFRLWWRIFGTVTASVFWLCYVTERLLLGAISHSGREVAGVLLLLLLLLLLLSSSSSSSPLCRVFTLIPETNYVPREYSVAAILLLLFMVLISLVSVLNLLYCIFTLVLSEVCVLLLLLLSLSSSSSSCCVTWHNFHY